MYLGAPMAVKASCTALESKAYFLCNSGEEVEELCWMLSKEKPQYLVGYCGWRLLLVVAFANQSAYSVDACGDGRA